MTWHDDAKDLIDMKRERDEARRLLGDTLAEGITVKEERDEARAIARRLANANTGEEFGRARAAFDALPWAKADA
jgi:hypothetical protein